jgi:hypothetical protein
MRLDEGARRGLEFRGAATPPAADLLVREFGKTALPNARLVS